ncbi:MAG: hypothetical protein GY896_18020 [Gammaproteobacteria bacterium]|nr:hypothetical protein [Gammaproteobacteria bacterium]
MEFIPRLGVAPQGLFVTQRKTTWIRTGASTWREMSMLSNSPDKVETTHSQGEIKTSVIVLALGANGKASVTKSDAAPHYTNDVFIVAVTGQATSTCNEIRCVLCTAIPNVVSPIGKLTPILISSTASSTGSGVMPRETA